MVIKKGDLVVCVSTDSQYLTNGKKYYVYETYSGSGIAIVDDCNKIDVYRKRNFCSISLYRDVVIKDILT